MIQEYFDSEGKIQAVETEPHILDSGDRTEFETGAVRDMREGKGRCDLLPMSVIAEYFRAWDVATDLMISEFFYAIDQFQNTGNVKHLYAAIQFANPFGNIFTTILELAKHFEEGAKKYGDDNWKMGIPAHVYIDSAIRHYLKFLREDKDEPHDRAVIWNLMCCIWTCEHKPELNDYAKADPA